MREKIQKRFGKVVRKERMKAGLSQEKLAEKAGFHRTYMGMIERGEKNITIANIEKISRAFKIPISELFKKT